MRAIKEGFGVAKSIWSMTFKMVGKYPCIFLPFFIIAICHAIILAILFYFPRPPVSVIFGPPVKTFFGEIFLHYPDNFLLLPRLFQYGQILVMITIGAIMFGMAAALIHQASIKGEENLRVTGGLNRAIRRYPTLAAIWIIIFSLNTMILRGPRFLFTTLLPKTQLMGILLQVVFYLSILLVFLIEVFFIYAYPAAIIEGKGLLGAIKRGLRISKKVLLPTFILIAVPRLLEILVIVPKSYLLMRLNRFLPELTLVLLGLIIAVAFITDFLVISTTTNLFILTKEMEV